MNEAPASSQKKKKGRVARCEAGAPVPPHVQISKPENNPNIPVQAQKEYDASASTPVRHAGFEDDSTVSYPGSPPSLGGRGLRTAPLCPEAAAGPARTGPTDGPSAATDGKGQAENHTPICGPQPATLSPATTEEYAVQAVLPEATGSSGTVATLEAGSPHMDAPQAMQASMSPGQAMNRDHVQQTTPAALQESIATPSGPVQEHDSVPSQRAACQRCGGTHGADQQHWHTAGGNKREAENLQLQQAEAFHLSDAAQGCLTAAASTGTGATRGKTAAEEQKNRGAGSIQDPGFQAW